MWKIIGFCFIFLLSSNIYSQNRFKYIKIESMEGVSETRELNRMGGEVKYMQLLKEFEKSFSKVKNGCPDYYRSYSIIDYTLHKLLEVKLYPKKEVSAENRKKLYYWLIPMNTKIFKVYYNINTKK